jgi:hypothetical protein
MKHIFLWLGQPWICQAGLLNKSCFCECIFPARESDRASRLSHIQYIYREREREMWVYP